MKKIHLATFIFLFLFPAFIYSNIAPAITAEYLFDHRGNLIASVEDNQKTAYLYDEQNRLKAVAIDDEPFYEFAQAQLDSKGLFENSLELLQMPVDALLFIKDRLQSIDQLSTLQSPLEQFLHSILEKRLVTLLGYNPHPTHHGIVGSGHIDDKVRITSINGILNAKEDAIKNSMMISQAHGGEQVHYIYSKTEGFTGDLLRCIVIKAGATSPQAKLLAETWKKLIEDMGGEESDGEIIHYAHSLGGTDTFKALQFMTPAERKHIRIYTFGSATLIGPDEAAHVQNFVSSHDGIAMAADLHSYFMALYGLPNNATIVDAHNSIPLIDHTLDSSTYHDLIEELGAEFQDRYPQNSLISKSIELTDVVETITALIQQKNFEELIKVISKHIGGSLSVHELTTIAQEQECIELKRAIQGAEAIYSLQGMTAISVSDLIPITLFIETEMKEQILDKKYYLSRSKTKLAYTVEYDPQSQYTFIHLRDDEIGYLGRGAHKLVLKSIIYSRKKPELVARCMFTYDANETEIEMTKKFNGKPGLIEIKALIYRKKVGKEARYDLFLKLYNSGTISKFIGTPQHESLTLTERLEIAQEIMEGLSYIHNANCAHRDLHLGNFFLHVSREPDSEPKLHMVIGDYGRLISLKECNGVLPQAARNFQPPESYIYGELRGQAYHKCDIYAIGCVLYSLLHNKRPPWFTTDKVPFPRRNASQALLKRRYSLYLQLKNARKEALAPIRAKIEKGESLTKSEKFERLIFSMIHTSARKRPSAQEVRNKIESLLR